MAPLEDVYCTLLMSDSYLPGAAVLANSLRDAGTRKKLAVLITLDTLSADTVAQLKTLYDYLIPVERIRNPNPANLYLMGRPDLACAFTKIALWRQTQFRKIVYLDADVVALRALDELFDIDASFAAAPDIGWPDAFNSGVMVITPDMGEYWALQTMAATGDSFDGADQGLLNQYFEHRPWQRLKFTYNCTPNAEYQWEPAYRYYKRDISAVHFIGKTKPWSPTHSGGSGVYGELLARWWAVHNRHLAKQEAASRSATGEQSQGKSGAEVGTSQGPTIAVEPEAPATSTEPPMTEPGEGAENSDQGLAEPTSTVQQHQFSAPLLEWDATRSEPPAQSKPEAANFPSAQYTFSESKQLFQAPATYAEPPKDMWYKVPEIRPKSAEAPKPIFPWEQQADRPRPTRVFAEDLPPEPTPAPEVPSPTHPFSTVHYEDGDDGRGADKGFASSEPVSSPKTAEDQWQSFQQTSANAWDSVPGIENYVRSIVEARDGKHGKTLKQEMSVTDLDSPLLERRDRRESLIITDFPTAVERPSLPVTPAAIRRPSFWGEERDEAGELPGAEGVPDQNQWNPEVKLEQLRRSSLIEIEHLKKDEHPNPPLRALPEHSVLEDENAKQQSTVTSQQETVQTGGIAAKDFAQSSVSQVTGLESSTTTAGAHSSQQSTSGGLSSEGLFVSTTQQSSGWSQQQSSSSSQQLSSTEPSGQQVTAGTMTFKLPDFGGENTSEASAAGERLLSPTQPQGKNDEGKGAGLFW